MKKIKIKCPAKINLTLKVLNKRDDGFHDIESIMQNVNLYDYLTISTNFMRNDIILNGNSNDIPYDNKNIVYKAAFEFKNIVGYHRGLNIFIEKNIPVCAGLAGGSTDGAGVLFGLNKLFGNKLSNADLHKICAKLGSDLNFCLEGGKMLAKGRGEKLTKLPFEDFNLTIVKPLNIAISTPFAYNKFDEMKDKSTFDNDLEFALKDEYEEFGYLRNSGFRMSGSGSAFFKKGDDNTEFDEKKYVVWRNLRAIENGVQIFS